MVLVGVIEDVGTRKLCADAVGIKRSVCGLTVDLTVSHQRLMHRHETEPEARRWHLAGAGELAGDVCEMRVLCRRRLRAHRLASWVMP